MEKNFDKECMELTMKLEKLLEGVEHRLEWAKARNGRLGVRISYTDFLSEGMLLRMLADVIPSRIRVSTTREYSDGVLARMLLDEYKKNRIAVVDCYGGSIITEPLQIYVNRKLAAVEMVG